MNASPHIHIAFLCMPGFPISALASAADIFRTANEILDHDVITWSVFGAATSDGAWTDCPLPKMSSDLQDLNRANLVMVLGGIPVPAHEFRHDETILRRLAVHGVHIAGLDSGVFLLASAGLLNNCECSVHHALIAAFAEKFPEIRCSDTLVSKDRNRVTIAGVSTLYDFLLGMISDKVGSSVANEIACVFQHPFYNLEATRQRGAEKQLHPDWDTLPKIVLDAIEYYLENIEEPPRIKQIAERCGVSCRQLERIFKKATGTTPGDYLKGVRLGRARQLVRYTDKRIGEIAMSVGYQSLSSMTPDYRKRFGLNPSDDRGRFAKHNPRPVDAQQKWIVSASI